MNRMARGSDGSRKSQVSEVTTMEFGFLILFAD